jgi:hypothetical protein
MRAKRIDGTHGFITWSVVQVRRWYCFTGNRSMIVQSSGLIYSKSYRVIAFERPGLAIRSVRAIRSVAGKRIAHSTKAIRSLHGLDIPVAEGSFLTDTFRGTWPIRNVPMGRKQEARGRRALCHSRLFRFQAEKTSRDNSRRKCPKR